MFGLMFKDAGIKDPLLVEHLLGGIPLVGEACVTGEFPARRKPPTFSIEQVMKAAKWTRKAALGRSGRSGDEALDKEVWAKTKKEIDQKLLHGPYTVEQLKELMGPCRRSERTSLEEVALMSPP